jgi:hypothetical protein
MLWTQWNDSSTSAKYVIDTARCGVRIQHCSEEFAGAVLVRDVGIGELFDASGIHMRINSARPAWIELLRSYRYDFVADKGSAPVGPDETV